MVGLEPAAARKQDSRIYGGQEDFFFDLRVGFTGSDARVFAPIDLDPVLFEVLVSIFQ